MASLVSVTRPQAEKIIRTYIQAWEGKDCELLEQIFSPAASYLERYYSDDGRFVGLAAIKAYWLERVVRGQREINVRLLNLYCDGHTIIAEWEARFFDVPTSRHKEIHEVAIIEVDADGKIGALREFWHSREIDQPIA